MDLEWQAKLDRGNCLIADMERRIALQRRLIRTLADLGHSTREAENILRTMVDLLERTRERRNFILKQLLPFSVQ